MNLLNKLKQRMLSWGLPLPFSCRHLEYSVIASLDDEMGKPNSRLIDLAISAISEAQKVDFSQISKRTTRPLYEPNIWPGEHYKLLAGLVSTLKPQRVIEIGTFQGMGSLSVLHSLPVSSKLITVDIIPWKQIPESVLLESDFEKTHFEQVIGDLSDRKFFDPFLPTLKQCDLLFVDAPKNISFEQTLLQYLDSVELHENLFVLFDDIRVWNMLKIWREIKRPKLDLTSFGHWSGTGLVDWNRTISS